jgi:uncharacterized protein YjiS (DUF1127 family)
MLLEKLNELISTLSYLSDKKYMDYILNAGALTDELLKDVGITEEYLNNTLDKFEKLRIALFGDCIDWQGLVQQELRAVAKSERARNKQNEDYIRKLQYEIRQLEGKQ